MGFLYLKWRRLVFVKQYRVFRIEILFMLKMCEISQEEEEDKIIG